MDSNRLPAITGPLCLPKVLWHIIKQYMAYCEECYSYIDVAYKYLIRNPFTYDVGRDRFAIKCSLRHNVALITTHLQDTVFYFGCTKYIYAIHMERLVCNIIHNQDFVYEYAPESDDNYVVTYEDHLRCVPMPPVPLTAVYKSHQEARSMLKHLLTLKKMNLI